MTKNIFDIIFARNQDYMRRNNFGRKSPRAQWHDYNGAEYFVTICTKNMTHYFGKIANGEMTLTEIGKYTEKCILKISNIHPSIDIPLYVIMPNHIHLIFIFKTPPVGLSYHGSLTSDNIGLPQCDSPTNTQYDSPTDKNQEMMRRANSCGKLSYIIGSFKSAVTKYANENDISFAWQARYHDHIIRNQREMNNIAQYIINNPTQWESDCHH